MAQFPIPNIPFNMVLVGPRSNTIPYLLAKVSNSRPWQTVHILSPFKDHERDGLEQNVTSASTAHVKVSQLSLPVQLASAWRDLKQASSSSPSSSPAASESQGQHLIILQELDWACDNHAMRLELADLLKQAPMVNASVIATCRYLVSMPIEVRHSFQWLGAVKQHFKSMRARIVYAFNLFALYDPSWYEKKRYSPEEVEQVEQKFGDDMAVLDHQSMLMFDMVHRTKHYVGVEVESQEDQPHESSPQPSQYCVVQ
jgi:hypothetical protein